MEKFHDISTELKIQRASEKRARQEEEKFPMPSNCEFDIFEVRGNREH